LAKIKLFTKDGILENKFINIDYAGSVGEFIADFYYEKEIPFSVYEGVPSLESDITFNEEKLLSGFGEYTIIETPSATLGVAGVLAIISIVITVAAILLIPNPKLPANINRQQESPNNSLGSRGNRARPLQRIPDIKGQVVAIPDVIAPTYKTYVGADVFEHGFYCVGRGEIDVDDVQDGDTPLNLMTGATAGVFYPNSSPNSGAPQFVIGEYVQEPVISAYRSNEIDGVDLPPEQDVGGIPILTGDTYEQLFVDPPVSGDINCIVGFQLFGTAVAGQWSMSLQFAIVGGLNIGSPDYYEGNSVVLENFFVKKTQFGTPVNISGTYEIAEMISVTPSAFSMYVILPDDFGFDKVPQAWYSLNNSSIKTVFSTPFNQWFYFTKELFDSAIVNITAPNGIFRDTGGASLLLLRIDYDLEVQGIEKIGSDWVDDGNAPIIVQSFLAGQSTALRGTTVEIDFDRAQYFKIRVKRTTDKFALSGTIVDKTTIADIYAVKNVDQSDFGDVTTIQTLTIGNSSASAVKERQLNCMATEKLFKYLGSGVFDTVKTKNIDVDGNSSAVQSFITDAIDPYIGNRQLSEIAADDLLALETEINDYFGNSYHAQFNFTFDSTETTFQEYAQTIFNAINCIAFRDGTTISALFEKPQTVPAMLFTHRSKKPNAETYTRKFNQSLTNDGIVFDYVDSVTNKTESIYLPDANALNPKKFNIAGIRNEQQATIRAYREWNKVRYRKVDCSVVVTAEGQFIRPNDMIAIVKGTRTLSFDGEILDQSGLTLTLSADVSFTPFDSHSITLKNEDGTTENIVCTAGTESNQVVLASPPAQTLRTGIDTRRTEFSFGNDARKESENWLIQEIDISEKWFVAVKGINYTDQYYANDADQLRAFSSAFSSAFG